LGSTPTKKPWAIDVSYFTPAKKPLYRSHMAVIPALQRQGIGSMLLKEAVKQARAWPADAIRLDAFDADAGAGAFYANCGFREVGRVTYRKAPPIYFEVGLSTTPNSSKSRRDAKTFRQKGLTRKARCARDARLRPWRIG